MVTLNVRYKYVHEDVDRHGNVRLYFRRRKGDPKIRILEKPGSDDFSKKYKELCDAADAGELKPAKKGGVELSEKGSFRWLCEQYLAAVTATKELDPKTIHNRRLILEDVWDEPRKPGSTDLVGNCPAGRVSPKLVRVLRDRKKATPGSANNRLKAIRAVYTWALLPENDISGISSNPGRDVARLKPSKPGGFHTWTDDEVEQYMKRHPIGTTPRLALDLLMFTGVRRSDVVLLGRQHLRNGWFRFNVYKNRNRHPVTLDIPCLPALAESIAATQTGDLTYLITSYGKPFTANGFGNYFRARCNEAGLKDCSAHGLRKAGAVRAAENGATTNQLMAIFGWASAKEAELYTQAAERKRLAGSATTLLASKR